MNSESLNNMSPPVAKVSLGEIIEKLHQMARSLEIAPLYKQEALKLRALADQFYDETRQEKRTFL